MKLMNMKKNVGKQEKTIRLGLGCFLLVLGLSGNNAIAAGMIVIGLALIVSGFMEVCFLYKILGISTCPAEPKAAPKARPEQEDAE